MEIMIFAHLPLTNDADQHSFKSWPNYKKSAAASDHVCIFPNKLGF